MYLNFGDIPGHQNLFLDYLQEFDNVEKFYKRNFREQEAYESLFKTLSEKERPHRAKLTDIIRAQYADNKISKQTQSNIEALYSQKTIAVVTGQQLGLFGGPLYTFYKSITAIKLCSYLKEKYEQYHFVPVFWLEGDDHDFDEVRSTNILNNENQIALLKYDDGQPEEINRGGIGGLKFNQNIEAVINELNENLRESEFKPSLVDLIKTIYQPGRTFLESFRELMIRLFDEYGLIVFNPIDPEVKRLLIPIFEQEITNYREQTGYLVERSAELEETYHAQVKVKAINLFYVDDNERLLIEPVENDYRLKGKRKRFTREDILAQLNFSPERFSPNVLLRPICQDYLLPTAFYVGGPGEISYFAQVTPMYDFYNITQPFIYPRSSATIVERSIKGILDKQNLNYLDVFTTEDELISKIVAANGDINLDKLYGELSDSIGEIFNSLNGKLSAIDKTLLDLSAKSKQRVEQTFDYLKTKTIEAEKRRHESAIRQITKARNVLYPNDNLQERELNLLYFLNKYGMDLIKWIYNELAINKFEHQVLEL
ncbi:MAG: bacillithiol biosynthesis cysteine-adding enzyme BshC [Ignavibacteriales bacterium]|nr:bacillithiol biosynthesis cysteine-adding enzyme BshC [Ignavibacteriales bacterium]